MTQSQIADTERTTGTWKRAPYVTFVRTSIALGVQIALMAVVLFVAVSLPDAGDTGYPLLVGMAAFLFAGGAVLYAIGVYWWTDHAFARFGRLRSLLAHMGIVIALTLVYAIGAALAGDDVLASIGLWSDPAYVWGFGGTGSLLVAVGTATAGLKRESFAPSIDEPI